MLMLELMGEVGGDFIEEELVLRLCFGLVVLRTATPPVVRLAHCRILAMVVWGTRSRYLASAHQLYISDSLS
jgi:hypothetical protein